MSVRGSVREDLLDAAERLFAAGGLDGVSLREINAAAGATNASAIQYHFGNREGLVRALLERHAHNVATRRAALLDALDPDAVTVRSLAEVLVRPWAAELDEPGGAGFLQVLSDLLNHPRYSADSDADVEADATLARWRALVATVVPAEALRRHRRFVAIRFTVTELARRAHAGRSDHRRFTDELVDLVSGLLTAPITAHDARSRRAAGR